MWVKSRRRPGGQTLVEFALVLPLFIAMLMGLIEFSFIFNAVLSVNYASRDAALAAAEAGNGIGADCVILGAVDSAIGAPTADDRIDQIEIYRVDPNGAMIGLPTVYERTGSTQCTFIDGTTSTQPYTLGAGDDGYPVADRCNILAGCDPAVSTDTVDIIAVRITYTHPYVTPLVNFAGGGGGTITFDRSSIMRMEPVL